MLKLSNLFVINIKRIDMSSEKPTIYISKRCGYCIDLLKILSNRPEIRGNFTIISIDDTAFPNYVKAVPCMVSGEELYSAKDIFAMLDDSGGAQEGAQEGAQAGAQAGGQCSTSPGQEEGEKECSIDGYCPGGGDNCLGFASIDGPGETGSLDEFFSTIDESKASRESAGNGAPKDDYQNQKKAKFDSEYERMMSARGDMDSGGGRPEDIDFSR
jgi:hypothetical protein